MDDKNFKFLLSRVDNFEIRRAVERLREGLFDPLGIKMLTTGEEKLDLIFDKGVCSLEKGSSFCQIIEGAYGQGKSHILNYIKQRALAQGFVVSYINLDPRQVPFHNFKNVYRALMANMVLPTDDGSFTGAWKNYAKNWLSLPENITKTLLDLIPDQIPHRFRSVLFAMAKNNMSIPVKKRNLKKHVRFKPAQFSWILKNALNGKDIPVWRLRPALYYRQVPFYKEHSLVCRRNDQYLDMFSGMAQLFKRIGFKGWVLLFDEGESIAQTRITSRSKSYALLDKFFYPQTQMPGFYSVFAFTPDFSSQIKNEIYDQVRILKNIKNKKLFQKEVPYFEKNYYEAWKKFNKHTLNDLTTNEWKALTERLVVIHAAAYRWQPGLLGREEGGRIQEQLNQKISTYNGVEPRLKLKLLVNHLDIVHQKMILDPNAMAKKNI